MLSLARRSFLSIARRRILVVCDSLALANNLLMWLNDAGYNPAVVTTFIAAKEQLRTAPDVLLTELKLREYNGLHLALRASRDGIPAAVIGADPAFAGDAHAFGASYVARDNVHRDDIVLLVDGLLSASRAQTAAAHELPFSAAGDSTEAIGGPDEWDRNAGTVTRSPVH